MFPPKTLLFLIFFTMSAAGANPLVRDTGKATLSFATKFTQRGTLNIAENARARAQAMKQTSQVGRRSASLDIANSGFIYTAQVGVGNPATMYTLEVDTGSSNTFVGPNKQYTPTNTSKNTGNTISVTYGSGGFSGEEWLDTVTLAPGLVIHNQSIGVANSSSGFSDVDGILGLGPVDLTYGTVKNTGAVPTVMDNLLSQGSISEEVLGVYFAPTSQDKLYSTGELTFGGYDDWVITGSVNYVPITTTSPACKYWGINQTISYGSTTILSSAAGIVDTGSTLLMMASDAFQTYQHLTGGIPDNATGLLSITSDQYANLQPLTFDIGGNSYNLSPNGQIWPRSLNSVIGGNSSSIYLIVGNLGFKSGAGFDFVNGYPFLERFYSVYDTTNRRVGFASTYFTDSTSN